MSQEVPRQRARGNHDWRPAFLAAYAACGVVLTAAGAAQITARTVHREKAKNAAFAAECEAARQVGALTLEAEATRRARDGCKRLVLYKGQPVRLDKAQAQGLAGWIEAKSPTGEPLGWGFVYELEYSDALLALLLKRHFPNEYRENSKVEHSGGVKIVRLPVEDMEAP